MNRRLHYFVSMGLVLLACGVALGGENRVLLVGIDGAGGRYTQAADTPNLDSLAAAGAARFDFLNEAALLADPPEPYGSSGVNWSTVNTGASAASHGVHDNFFDDNSLANFPHWFKYVKEHDPTLFTASIVNWAPINELLVPDEYADLKVQFSGQPAAIEDMLVRDEVVKLLDTGDPAAVFVHFDQVDQTGHAFAWGSPEYYAAIETVDGLIGDMMAALNARPGVVSGFEDWLVLVVADHGGEDGAFFHGASQGPSDWEVPFILSGPSVPDGATFGPGTLRDVAPTALWHLGIDPSTTNMEGHVVGVSVVPEPTPYPWIFLALMVLQARRDPAKRWFGKRKPRHRVC